MVLKKLTPPSSSLVVGLAELIDKPSPKPSIRSTTPAAISVASIAMGLGRDGRAMGDKAQLLCRHDGIEIVVVLSIGNIRLGEGSAAAPPVGSGTRDAW